MAEGEIVEPGRGDLLGRDHDLVAVGLARDRDGAVDHPDVPGHGCVGGPRGGNVGGNVLERAVRGALGREDAAVDGRLERGELDRRMVRIEDRDHLLGRGRGCAAGHGGEVVCPIDRGAVVDVVGARDDDGPDPRFDQAGELRRDALHRAARLDVRVEQVAGDQEQVDLLGQGEIDRGLERRELTFALGGRLLTEIVVPRAEMDVRGMDDPEHRPATCLLAVSFGRPRSQPRRAPGATGR